MYAYTYISIHICIHMYMYMCKVGDCTTGAPRLKIYMFIVYTYIYIYTQYVHIYIYSSARLEIYMFISYTYIFICTVCIHIQVYIRTFILMKICIDISRRLSQRCALCLCTRVRDSFVCRVRDSIICTVRDSFILKSTVTRNASVYERTIFDSVHKHKYIFTQTYMFKHVYI